MQNCSYNNEVQKFLLAFCANNIWKIDMPFGMLVCQVKTLARRMVRWHVYWIRTLECKNEKLAHFWHVETQ